MSYIIVNRKDITHKVERRRRRRRRRREGKVPLIVREE